MYFKGEESSKDENHGLKESELFKIRTPAGVMRELQLEHKPRLILELDTFIYESLE